MPFEFLFIEYIRYKHKKKAALMDSLLSYDIRFGLQCVNVECE